MAQININEKTFAFSTRSDTWTSRYSFDPTCYMTSGNKMLSSKDGLGVWLHDQLSTRNKFYTNSVAKSSITVSANQDPSAVKMYKSLSLETNTKDWTAEVCTNVEYESEEKQKGSISSFEKKEGFQYAEMPRDVLNSTRNIVGKPFTVSSVSEELGSAAYDELVGEIESYFNAQEQFLDGWFPVIVKPSSNFSISDYPFSVEEKVKVYNINESNLLLSQFEESIDIYYGGYYLKNDVYYLVFYVPSPTAPQLESLLLFTSAGSPLFSNQLVIAVKPEIDGDQLRGPYANVEISTQTDKHAEIHAINVDYEFSKLDKRLTQNT